jgi:hypothetical protein
MESHYEQDRSWTLLTGHGHVLVEIARDPEARIRDISVVVDLTERTVQAIVADLEAAGYLTRKRIGRRTRYTLNPDNPFRHSAQQGMRVGPMLELLTAMADADAPRPAPQPRGLGPSETALAADASGKPESNDRSNRLRAI